MLDSDGWWPRLVLAEARNEEYSRISPAAAAGLALFGSGGTRRVGGFHGHPMLRSGAARNLGPMNHFPRACDTQTSEDLAPEKILCADRSCPALYVGMIYLSNWLQKHSKCSSRRNSECINYHISAPVEV